MSVLDRFRLDGKTALVTGCNRGIGQAIAIGLAEAGADIIGVSRNLAAEGSACEIAVKARGRQLSVNRHRVPTPIGALNH
jgi:2-deoxy-D-gluconate 3-dehydrogenase